MSRTHGMSTTSTYKSWSAMLSRTRPGHERYAFYGARGILVCPRWRESFVNFYADMGERPAGTTIERIDNDKGYEPGNCKWATRAEQNRNKRSLVMVTCNGQTKCVSQWAAELGVLADTLLHRIRDGWPPERAITTPIETRRWRKKP